ncbi:hypothetical protein [Microbacterium sp. bgisy203]|uniref:hypothetical protein n=1 Tax=Microbacterium sp. bgisy203 TaxID=3413799 RepID=UPI003D73B6E9
MTPSDLHTLPLTDDDTLERGLSVLLAPVVRRQLWILFLDDRDILSGPLMPSDDLPRSPYALYPGAAKSGDDRTAGESIAECFARVHEEFDFAALVLVWERCGSARLDDETRVWARELHRLFRAHGTPVRAQCLLSDRGVRVIPPDDLV